MKERFANWRVQVPLAACLLLVAVLAFLVFRYFLLTFTVAGSVALILAPLQRRLTRKLGGYSSAAAGLLVLGCTVVLLIPLIFFGVMLTQQAMAAFEWLRPHLEPAALEKLWRETLPARYPFLMAWAPSRSRKNSIIMNTIMSISPVTKWTTASWRNPFTAVVRRPRASDAAGTAVPPALSRTQAIRNG
jgi:predicted PurR-regulated permease PerM